VVEQIRIEQLSRAMQVGAGVGRRAGWISRWQRAGLQAVAQDVADGLVRRVIEVERALTGGIEALSAVLVGQTDDALTLVF